MRNILLKPQATIILLTLCLLCTFAQAQRKHAVEGGLGISYYYGDLTDNFNNIYLRPGLLLGYNYYVSPKSRFRLGFMYSQIGAADSMANAQDRLNRNLHFKSPISEFSCLYFYEFMVDENYEFAWRRKNPHFTPYLYIGVALFNFNPQARFDGQWRDLQPLGTEGQYLAGDYPNPYRRWQLAIPAGGGVNFRFSKQVGVNIEIAYRKTFTDYLDDVSSNYPDLELLAQQQGTLAADLSNQSLVYVYPGSQRGNASAKDGYFFASANLIFFIDD